MEGEPKLSKQCEKKSKNSLRRIHSGTSPASSRANFRGPLEFPLYNYCSYSLTAKSAYMLLKCPPTFSLFFLREICLRILKEIASTEGDCHKRSNFTEERENRGEDLPSLQLFIIVRGRSIGPYSAIERLKITWRSSLMGIQERNDCQLWQFLLQWLMKWWNSSYYGGFLQVPPSYQ